jgi:N-ethylmaleimide reductase
MPELLTAWTVGDIPLRNRVVMAPLTRLRASADGVPSIHSPIYYEQRSSAGLIVSEATNISPRAVGFIGTPGIYTSAQVEGWKRVTQAVHGRGGKMFLQLSHVGRLAHPSLHGGAQPVAPSGIEFSGLVFTREGMVAAVRPRELGFEEIQRIVEDYARAAANAIEAGFDGVEIHAASGMLPMQFLHSHSNVRTDDYGGTAERRSRFILEVIDACLSATGPYRTGLRVCPTATYGDAHDLNPLDTYTYLFQQLQGRALGYIHIVESAQRENIHQPDPRSYKALARCILDCRIIAASGYDQTSADAVIAAALADAVAFGALYISNPDLVERFSNGWPTAAKPDPSVYYGEGVAGYIDFPALSRS